MNDTLDDFPEISQALIDAIKARLPERWPDVNMTLRDIDKRAGSWAIVGLLEAVFDHQASEALAAANSEPKDNEQDNVLRFPSGG